MGKESLANGSASFKAERSDAFDAAERYLVSLGLAWKSLGGKHIADIGSQYCVLAEAAQKRGINTKIVSLDIKHESLISTDKNVQGRVVADAFKALPLASDSMDFVLVRGLSLGIDDQNTVMMNEMLRVLKGDGEIRVWPALRGKEKFIIGPTPTETTKIHLKTVLTTTKYWLDHGYDLKLVRIDPKESKGDNIIQGAGEYYWSIGKNRLNSGDEISLRKNEISQLIDAHLKEIDEKKI